MNPTIDRLKLIFLGVFAVMCAGLWAYQIFYVWPAKRCDADGMWWDRATRICAQPIYIPSLTGRPAGMSRKEWSEKQAARQNERDAEGYPVEDVAPSPKAAPAPAPKAAPMARSAAAEAEKVPATK